MKNVIAERKQLSAEEYHSFHVEQGLSPLEIAQITGWSKAKIYYDLRKFGIYQKPSKEEDTDEAAMRKTGLTAEELAKRIKELRDSGEKQKVILSVLNIDAKFYYRMIREYGIKLNPKYSVRLDVPAREVIDLYVNKKWSVSQIAKHFNCGIGTVIYRLEKNGIVVDHHKKNRSHVKVNNEKIREITYIESSRDIISDQELIEEKVFNKKSFAQIERDYGIQHNSLSHRFATIKLDCFPSELKQNIKEEFLKDKNVHRVSKLFDLQKSVILNILKEFGIKGRCRFEEVCSDEQLYDMYVVQLMKIDDIRLYFGFDYVTIKKRLDKMGVDHEEVRYRRDYPLDEIKRLVAEGKCKTDIMAELGIGRYKLDTALKYLGYIELQRGSNTKRKPKGYISIRSLDDVPENCWNFVITEDFLRTYDDVEKARYIRGIIHRSTHRRRDHMSEMFAYSATEFVELMDHFYYDKQFNSQYSIWLKTQTRNDKPSIDHIVPLSKFIEENPETGLKIIRPEAYDISNLQTMSWSENRLKNDMTMEEYMDTVEIYFGKEARKIQEAKYYLT